MLRKQKHILKICTLLKEEYRQGKICKKTIGLITHFRYLVYMKVEWISASWVVGGEFGYMQLPMPGFCKKTAGYGIIRGQNDRACLSEMNLFNRHL